MKHLQGKSKTYVIWEVVLGGFERSQASDFILASDTEETLATLTSDPPTSLEMHPLLPWACLLFTVASNHAVP